MEKYTHFSSPQKSEISPHDRFVLWYLWQISGMRTIKTIIVTLQLRGSIRNSCDVCFLVCNLCLFEWRTNLEETLIFKIRQQSIQSCCRVRTFAQYYLRKNHHHPLCHQHHEQAGVALGDRFWLFIQTLNIDKKPFNSIFNSKTKSNYSFKEFIHSKTNSN